MAANGRGSMRAQSRSPPFVVIGLLVALVILGANYWNMSSNNSKLAFEVAELQDQVRQISAKRISAEKKIDSMAESYNRNKDTLAQKESDVKSLNNQIGDKVEELQTLGKDKESCQNNLKNCEDNSNGIQQELQKVKEEVEQLKKKEQEAATNTQNCDSVCADQRKMIIDAVEKTMGINAVQTLHQAGVDVGDYKDKFGSQNQGQAEQPPKPDVKDDVNAGAQKQVQSQGGEKLDMNNQPKVASDPKHQQPAETNALPQEEIKPQAGQGQANVLPLAQGQAQLLPDPKVPQNPEQAALNPLNPADSQKEGNIIPPGQSNPDLPNPQVNQQVPPPGNVNLPQEQAGNPKDSPDTADTYKQQTHIPAQSKHIQAQQTDTPVKQTEDDPQQIHVDAQGAHAPTQSSQTNPQVSHAKLTDNGETTLATDNSDTTLAEVAHTAPDVGRSSPTTTTTTPFPYKDDYDDDADAKDDEKLKFIPGNDKAADVKVADDSIDTLEKKLKSQDQQK